MSPKILPTSSTNETSALGASPLIPTYEFPHVPVVSWKTFYTYCSLESLPKTDVSFYSAEYSREGSPALRYLDVPRIQDLCNGDVYGFTKTLAAAHDWGTLSIALRVIEIKIGYVIAYDVRSRLRKECLMRVVWGAVDDAERLIRALKRLYRVSRSALNIFGCKIPLMSILPRLNYY